MRKEEYEIMYNVEEDYWWYAGLRKLVMSYIERVYTKKTKLKILDAGCGTGMMLHSCNNHEAYGLDFSKEALKFCRKGGLSNLLQGSIKTLPFKDNYFDIVLSFDVIGQEMDVPGDSRNIHKDNIRTLKEISRVMNRNGMLIVNLPAYNFMRSNHDKAVGINKRYTIKELKDNVQKAGFDIEHIAYRNTILFPFVAVKRLIEKLFVVNSGKVASDLKPLPDMFNDLFKRILYLENRLLKANFNFPFGLSIYCVARKI